MAEVSVLSPSRSSDPGAASTPAAAVVDIVDVDVEDDDGGGGTGINLSVMSTDSDRALDHPQAQTTDSASDSTPCHNACPPGAVPRARTDDTASDPGPGPWPRTSPNRLNSALDPLSLISPTGNKRRSTTAEPEDDDDHPSCKKKRHRRKEQRWETSP